MNNELRMIKRSAKKKGRALRVIGWILLLLFAYCFTNAFAFLSIDSDTADESSLTAAKILLAASVLLTALGYVLILTGNGKRRKAEVAAAEEAAIPIKKKTGLLPAILIPVITIWVSAMVCMTISNVSKDRIISGSGDSKAPKSEFIMTDDQCKEMEKLTKDMKLEEILYGFSIGGEAAYEAHPWIAVRQDKDKREKTGYANTLFGWSEAGKKRNSGPTGEDVKEIKTIVFCRYYVREAAYIGGGRGGTGTSEGVYFFYVNADTGDVYDQDEIEAKPFPKNAATPPHYKITEEEAVDHIEEYFKNGGKKPESSTESE